MRSLYSEDTMLHVLDILENSFASGLADGARNPRIVLVCLARVELKTMLLGRLRDGCAIFSTLLDCSIACGNAPSSTGIFCPARDRA